MKSIVSQSARTYLHLASHIIIISLKYLNLQGDSFKDTHIVK